MCTKTLVIRKHLTAKALAKLISDRFLFEFSIEVQKIFGRDLSHYLMYRLQFISTK